MQVTVDPQSGFCFGVVYAIQTAEDELAHSNSLYCLGDIVHNNMEVERLQNKGLKVIDHEQLKSLKNARVLIRAHGEPPETYRIAIENNIELVDASCPVVLKLQNRIRQGYEEGKDVQVVVYGKAGHAEVNGLIGQTNGTAIIVENKDDLAKIDFRRPIRFFSQTTQPTAGFHEMVEEITRRVRKEGKDAHLQVEANDTLCRQVSNREPRLRNFSLEHNVILFVSGKKSSNGKALYEVCKEVNPRTYFLSSWSEVDLAWFKPGETVGICGATSTPRWLMDDIAGKLRVC
ncbi:MAG: 4-hydroxy-3-methylbut-2-enyl diphosphate reductase [Bacteroidia bacterium]|jgi:4-hydroxy-3-methylbut-2-enyl diphosphate reductase|nr:4-hydroxy-3-methylbut-2-enyl diphosphate reductase [Bacteroidia bacterium]MCC6767868.1 4-hydroxy-3-methylbut-2-enyl diphosphate reductase [Bacteroidia bacterium]